MGKSSLSLLLLSCHTAAQLPLWKALSLLLSPRCTLFLPWDPQSYFCLLQWGARRVSPPNPVSGILTALSTNSVAFGDLIGLAPRCPNPGLLRPIRQGWKWPYEAMGSSLLDRWTCKSYWDNDSTPSPAEPPLQVMSSSLNKPDFFLP